MTTPNPTPRGDDVADELRRLGVPEGDLDDAFQEVVNLVPRVQQAIAREMGLSRSELEALQHLAAGAMGPSNLARTLGVTGAAGSQVVDRLERRGHASREPDPSDARRVVVRPTGSALAQVVSHLMPMLEALHAAEEGMTPAEKEVVRRYLERSADALRLLLPEEGRGPGG